MARSDNDVPEMDIHGDQDQPSANDTLLPGGEPPKPQMTAIGEITRYLNVTNAKLFAILCVTVSILYHGFIHMYMGASSCHWLLSDGRFQGYKSWQPYGCMIHKYTREHSQNCMHYISYWGGDNHIVFLGDSRIRQLYFEFVNLLSPQPVEAYKAHADLEYTDDNINLRVQFLWQPIVDDSMVPKYQQLLKLPENKRPRILVTGSATWIIKFTNGSQEGLEGFTANLTKVVQYFDDFSNSTEIVWMLQDPVVESRLNENRTMITNERVDEYNRAAIDLVSKTRAKIWSSSRLIGQGYNADFLDGLHAGKVALSWDVQILINKYCNDHMNFNDGTCCASPEPLTTLQIVTAVLFGTSLVIYLVMSVHLRCVLFLQTPTVTPKVATSACLTPEVTVDDNCTGCCSERAFSFFNAMARLGMLLAFFLLCDRTNFFMKENKYYTHVNFFLPFLYLMILGLFFTEKCKQSTMLHRDQTDEWKGWMQLVILIYHLTGASQMLHIYMQIRVLVSSYIFLSGYGHFYYFYTTGDFSLHRFCKVLFRFNFLVILLCFVMNRPYQFYYFIPLVSFWFLMLYVTLGVWPRITAASVEVTSVHYLYLILKLVLLGVCITLLYASEVFFEKVFLTNPIKALFVTSDDSIQDWRFRWSMDRYSSIFGVLFCLALIVAKKRGVIDDSRGDMLFPKLISWLVCLLSVCGLLGYAIFIGFCRNRDECNEVHPYLSFVPIVCFVFLRNLFGWARAKYSTFFAWFGKFALELFIAQYHLWLAADTHGVLVLVPTYPVLNLVITSFVFVCAAHEIHTVTVLLADHAVPRDWRILVRNMVCFTAVIIPVAITHGAFGV